MMLPHMLFSAICIVGAIVIGETDDITCVPSTSVSSPATSCQKFDHEEIVADRRSLRDHVDLTELVSQIRIIREEELQFSSRQIVKRQVGWASHEECGNERLRQIIRHVMLPLLSVNQMKLGDIAKILQTSVQQATGKSYEITIGKGDMMIASHQKSEKTGCRMRIGDSTLRCTKLPSSGSGYPGQQPFPQSSNSPLVLQPRVEQSSLTQSSAAQSSVAQSSVAQSSVAQSSLAQSSVVQFPLAQPSLLQAPYQLYTGGEYFGVPAVGQYGGVPAFLFGAAGAGACFSGGLIVETIEGPKRMSELKTSDEVLSIDQTTVSFSPIIMFLHRDEELLAEFNVITTADGDSVKLTNDHLIYVSDCDPPRLHIVRAKDVSTEHCLMVAKSPNLMLATVRVTNITKVYERGIYAPLTSTGDIIVNDILSSCHSNLAVRSLQDTFFKVYRYLSFILPDSGEFPHGLSYFISALDLFIPIKAVLG